MGAGKGDALLPFFMEKNSKGKEKNPAGGPGLSFFS
jgi:hypothetical protein